MPLIESKIQTVADWSTRKVQSFLEELKLGMDDFASISSMTKQITHEYHSRFIIELIQNAHDPLPASGGDIRIIYDQPNHNFYIANTGTSFTDDNFKSISKLGQSSKEPNSSIGNKGIGFKSVLEVSDEPEIHSGPFYDGAYQGYAFRFSPKLLYSKLPALLKEMIETGMPVDLSPLVGYPIRVPNWIVQQQFQELRFRLMEMIPSTIEVELNGLAAVLEQQILRLSPYQFPLPIQDSQDPIIQEFGLKEYATVIKLPIKNASSLQKVEEALRALDFHFLLFLPKLHTISITTIQSTGTKTRSYHKEVEATQWLNLNRVTLFENGTPMSSHWISTLTVYKSDPGFVDALTSSDLPEKWLELTEATLNISIEESRIVPTGKFAIFFPTEEPTTMPFWVNGSFFGDLSRTELDFKTNHWNTYLLKRAGELLYSSIEQLSHMPAVPVTTLMDLISFSNQHPLFTSLKDTLSRNGQTLSEWKLFPNYEGKRKSVNLKQLYILPTIPEVQVMTPDRISKFSEEILTHIDSARTDKLNGFAKAIGMEVIPSPTLWAYWAEKMATELLSSQADILEWDQFYDDLFLIHSKLGNSRDGIKDWLAGKSVFLTSEDTVAASQNLSALYFYPRSNTQQLVIPSYIKDRFAFLHPKLAYSEQDTEKSLLEKFATRYEYPRLMESVVLPAYREKGVTTDHELFKMLEWVISLYRDSQLDRLGDVLLPCRGGWYPAKHAIASSDWSSIFEFAESMTKLCEFSKSNATGFSSSDHLLLDFSAYPDFLQQLGVVSIGRFFREIGVSDVFTLGRCKFRVIGNGSQLSFSTWENAPTRYYSTLSQWIQLTSNPDPSRRYTFNVECLLITQHDIIFSALPHELMSDFSSLLLASIEVWIRQRPNWSSANISKMNSSSSFVRNSPLMVLLKELKWIPTKVYDAIEYRQPNQTILIPDAASRHAHLPHVEKTFAQRVLPFSETLSKSAGLLNASIPDATSGASLLTFLAGQYVSEDDRTFRSFYNHMWNQYLDHPNFAQSKVASVLVQTSDGIINVSANEKLYLVAGDEKGLRNRLLKSNSVRILLAEQLNKGDIEKLHQAFGWLPSHSLKRTIGPVYSELGKVEELLENDHRNGLIVFLLAIACFGHGNPIKPGSTTFLHAKKILQETVILNADRLTVSLVDENHEVLHVEDVDWVIDHEKRIFYLTSLVELKDRIAEGIAELLDNSQLIYPLKVAMMSLKGLNRSKEERMEVLRNMEIDQEQVKLIELLLNDELTLIRDNLDLIIPACGLPMMDLHGYDTVESLKTGLQQEINPTFADFLMVAARKTSNLEIGHYLYEQRGVTLRTWNSILLQSQVRHQAVINLSLNTLFQEHKSRTRNRVLALVRWHALQTDNSEWYKSTLSNYAKWSLPSSWALEDWTIQNDRFEEETKSWFESQGLSKPEAWEPVNNSPEEISRSNYKLWKEHGALFLQIGKLLSNRNGHNFPYEDIDVLLERILPEAQVRFQWREYDEATLIQMVSPLYPPTSVASSNVQAWMIGYGFSQDDVNQEKEAYRKKKEEEREKKLREQRTLDVAGTPFEVTEESLYDMGEILKLLAERLTSSSSLDSPLQPTRNPDTTTPPSATPSSGGTGGGKGSVVPNRPTTDQDKGIGYAAEFFMHHWLKTHHDITPESWVSGNRRYYTKGIDSLDDTLGYDFVVYKGGKTFFIEVKGTRGMNELIRLGPTETAAARDSLQRERTGEPVQFVIAFVTEVLSKPHIEFLVNPFSSEGALFYTFPKEDGGVQLTFSLKNAVRSEFGKMESN